MTILSLDVESRSTVDLRKAGAHRYWEDEETALWCACYAFDDEPVETWLPKQPCPPRIVDHVRSGGIISAWNAQFERLAWQHCLVDVHGWPVARLKQFEDTAAWAAAMSLPRALGFAAKAVGAEFQKDDEGHRLMMRMSKPRKPRKGEPDKETCPECQGWRVVSTDPDEAWACVHCEGRGWVPHRLWWDDADRVQRLVAYCATDVETERDIRKRLIALSDAERDLYHFDQRMNDRGVRIDTRLVNALLKITDEAKADLDRQMYLVTVGQVSACSQVARLIEWVSGELCWKVDSLDKNSVASLLAMPDIPDHVREALELRQQAAKSSTAKLTAMLNCVSADDRARGLHLYHGAGTGRWAGRLIQTQNMPRGTGVVPDPSKQAETLIGLPLEIIQETFGPPMSAVSDCLRSCLVASEGHRLLVADYSSIEGRVTAWLAGEAWKIEAFIANDEGRGPGMYEINAASIFNMPVEVIGKKSNERQTGKASELALGFGGGVKAYDSMAKIYGIDMAPIYPILRKSTDPETFERAIESYDRWKESGLLGTDLMSREAWIASEVTKVLWRAKHPETVALWEGLESKAFEAVENPGAVTRYGRISFIVRRGFLWMRLPSGRCLAYGAPKIKERDTPWGDRKDAVTAMGVDSVTRKWRRFALYGGLLTENAVQAIARDLIAVGMMNAERAGYPIVLTVHDEAVADTPDSHGSLEDFSRHLCDMPAWAAGLPVVADGYESFRYKKD